MCNIEDGWTDTTLSIELRYAQLITTSRACISLYSMLYLLSISHILEMLSSLLKHTLLDVIDDKVMY